MIAHHRVEMFRDMGELRSEALAEELRTATRASLVPRLAAGAYVGWLAVVPAGRVIAGAGVDIKPQLPRVALGGTRIVAADVPLVVNVYTEPEYRRQGIARALMLALMEWARTTAADRVVLHASSAGRALYESLGFVATNEMLWRTDSGG